MTLAILEIVIYMTDLDAAEKFYGDLIGLEKITRFEKRHVFYKLENSVFLIFNPDETEKDGGSGMPGHGTRGRGHFCFAASRGEQAVWEEKLNGAGYETVHVANWPGGTRSVYFTDPGGNSVEFAEPALWGI